MSSDPASPTAPGSSARPRVLVTGGAGYVGSHCARHLVARGYEVRTFDDLSHGHREAAQGELVVGDLRDRGAVRRALQGVGAVLHFAARMSVPESVSDPVGYWDVNVGGTATLLSEMQAAGVDCLVFSSTCAVYGEPPVVPIPETSPFAPISPYGATKAAVEQLLGAARAAGVLRATSLRYFNAAGAASDGSLGEAHHPETHLIPVALAAAKEGREMTLFGTDHPTPDGTAVRDYVHVEDLAEAHALALEQLLAGSRGGSFNLGSGEDYSVRQVLDMVAEVSGLQVKRREAPARPGDAPRLVSDTRHTEAELGWRTRRDLRQILTDAWRWHQAPRFGPDA